MRKIYGRLLSSSSVATAMLSLALPAAAQSEPRDRPAQAAETTARPVMGEGQETDGSSAQTAPAPVTNQMSGDAGIADIVVTASRRSESAQRAALSVQAISADTLARANVSKPEDLTSVATGVQIGTAGPFPQTYIRGVGNYSATVFAESAVAYNVDNVYVSRTWGTRGVFFDIDRVEVLKGPQGTLYGRNASGGAINIISVRPRLGVTEGFAEVNVGNYNLLQGTGAINLPLGSDLALRVAGQVTRRDGYLSDGYDNDRTQAVRSQLLWKPSTDLSILLNGSYQHVGGKGAGPSPLPGIPGEKFVGASDPRATAVARAQPGIGGLLSVPLADGYVEADVYGISAEINADVGFATLTVLPAYRYSKLSLRQYLPGFPVNNEENDKQTSLEARLSNDTTRLKWVLGGFLFDEKQANLPGKSVLIINQGINRQDTASLDLQTRSYAAFGQATYSVTDRFRVTGGLRYTYERKKHVEQLINNGLPNQAPPPACVAGTFDPITPYAPLFCRLVINTDQRLSFKSVTFKAGAEFDVGPRSLLYGNISTGFKSGGFFSAPTPNTFRPEKLTSFEIGSKNRFFDNRLQLNLEGFYWKYRDHQESFIGPTSIPGFFTFLTTNAGKAESYGLDLDIVYRATPADDISFKTQYNKTKYNSFVLPYASGVFGPPNTGCAVGPQNGLFQSIDCSGKPLVQAPKWSGTVAYSHTFDLGTAGTLVAGPDLQFASNSYLTPDFLDLGRQKSYTLANFDLTYTSANRQFMISAYANNIFNLQVYNQAFRNLFVSPSPVNPLAGSEGQFVGTLRPPRTYGVRARVSF